MNLQEERRERNEILSTSPIDFDSMPALPADIVWPDVLFNDHSCLEHWHAGSCSLCGENMFF